MLKSTGKSNYYTFRLHYWDWRSEIQSRDFERHATSTQAAIIIAAFRDGGTDIYLFNNNTLGETIMNSNGQPQVYGDLFGNGWNTICWYGGSGNIPAPRNGICNPNVNTGPLLRCPINPKSNLNVCNLHSSNWPDTEDVNNAINKPLYDTENYGLNVTGKSFRSFLEGFDASVSVEECAGFGLCKCGDRVDCDGDNSKPPVHRRLHNTVSDLHTIICVPVLCSPCAYANGHLMCRACNKCQIPQIRQFLFLFMSSFACAESAFFENCSE